MQVSICGKKLAECLSDPAICQRRHGKPMANLIFRRLAQLSAAPSLETMRNIGRCHELKGDRAGQFALDLVPPHRLIFKPCGKERDYLEGSAILWKKVSEVEVLEIVDYH